MSPSQQTLDQMLFRSQLVLPVQKPAVLTHLGRVILMISKGAVPEGLTLKQVNLEEVENHMAVVRQVNLKVEDVGIIQGSQVIQLVSH